jgi:hypothetical protein
VFGRASPEQGPRELLARRAEGSSASGKKAVGAVVDDSDLADIPSSSAKKDKDFDSLMKAADSFNDRMARKKRKGKQDDSDLSVVEDYKMAGISLDDSLEDESDVTKEMPLAARTGKVDTSVSGRITKWAAETTELVTNPTKIQITYATILAASISLLFLTGLLVYTMGGVRFRGDSLQVYQRRQRDLQESRAQELAIRQENWRRLSAAGGLENVKVENGGPGLLDYSSVWYGPMLPEYSGSRATQEEYQEALRLSGYKGQDYLNGYTIKPENRPDVIVRDQKLKEAAAKERAQKAAEREQQAKEQAEWDAQVEALNKQYNPLYNFLNGEEPADLLKLER